jgi:uncharacterized membrane protein YccC
MAGHRLRLGVLAKNPPGRAWFSARAAVCLAGPVAVGWACGDTKAGLLATLGGFTALYGSDRPYVSRAGHLAVVALGFAAAIALGDWTAALPWLAVLTVSAVAMVATLLCNALAVGPPGAYMFVLACAAGTGIAAAHLAPWRMGLLVLGGGAFAWIVHMAGTVRGLRRPERAAVAAAATAVRRYGDAFDTPDESSARRAAAQALHRSWITLVNFQPTVVRPSHALQQLRAVSRQLHLLFADVMAARAAGRPADPEWATRADELALLDTPIPEAERIPLGRPSTARLLRQAIRPRSGQLRVVARVGSAALIAGGLAAVLGVERAYWAIAAAVLVLHQGFNRRRTLQRGVERSIGTWLGLVLAGVVLALHPQGLWVAATLALLQFVIEMLVIPSYAAAAVFITAAALLIASGGQRIDDVTRLLLARGTDTLIGTAVAVVVYLATARRHDVVKLSETVAQALESAAAVAPHLATGGVTTAAAVKARRDLQLRTFDLQLAFDAAKAGSHRQRQAAERLWPAVAATEDFAYRTLARCWEFERDPGGPSHWPPGELEHFTAVVAQLADAVRTGTVPQLSDPLPMHGAVELAAVRDTLTGASG